MATLTTTPSISPSSLTISGKTSQSATISWTCPELPSGSTISSCVLTGVATASMTRGSGTIKVNNTTVTSGSTFTINLGTSNTTSSVAVTAAGSSSNSRGTVTFSNLNYTVTYEVPKEKYTVTFTDWDGTVLKEETVEEGSSATAPSSPTRTGYTFVGWDKDYSNITSATTITATYTINIYTVTFVDYDGTVLKTETVEYGGSATSPTPTRIGYTFTGWDKDYSNIVSNTTITAVYTINVYTVTFADYNGVILKTEKVEYLGSATAPSNPTRTGYTFAKWDKDFSSITSNITVTAIYTINTYTVTFVDWDETVLKEEVVEYLRSATAPSNPYRDGYIFIGWDKNYSNITSNLRITAQYKEVIIKNITRLFIGDKMVGRTYLGLSEVQIGGALNGDK